MSFTINNGADSPLESIYATDYWIVNKWFGDRLWGWGYNPRGELGDGTTVSKSSPVQNIAGGSTWKQIAAGAYHTTTIKTDGTLWVCGYNNRGQLGTNNTTATSSPIQTVTGGTNWKSAGAGYWHTGIVKTDGTLWVYGRNDMGQLGDGTIAPKSSPIQTIAGGTNWKQFTGGYYHSAAVKTDGTLWTCGYNIFGQLGDNSTTKKSSPVQTIAGGTNWKQVACGYYNTVAVKTDGTLWGWGYDGYGQLGRGTASGVSSPVQTITSGTNWKQVAQGGHHVAAIKTDGTLWTWGKNDKGQLGDNTTTNKSSPVQTYIAGTNWKQVACGVWFTVALKTDGTLWGWGQNNMGQLGDLTTTDKSSPIQIGAGGTNWKQVACGYYQTYAISINNINTTGT